MKRQIILLTALFMALIFQSARAQTYKHKLANQKNKAVEFALSRSHISVEGYNGNELVIENSDYHAPPKRAKGLHPLYGGGADNTGIGLSVDEENGVLKIVQSQVNDGKFTVKVPNNVRIKIQEVNWGGGGVDIRNHHGEIEVESKTGDINLQNVTGPVIASSTSGNVDITFSGLSDATPSSISLISGHIDLTVPASARANMKMSSISGEIYTDLDIKMKGDRDSMRRLGGGHTIEGTLNGGGVQLGLKTVSGDIYLRKSH